MCLRFVQWLDDRKWDRQWERDRPTREAREREEREREREEREEREERKRQERDFEYNFGSLQETQNEHVNARLACNALSSLLSAFQQENIAELANAVQLRVHRDALEVVHAEASDDGISWLESRRTISTLLGVIQDSWTNECLHRRACELLEILLKTRPNNQELIRSEGGLMEFIIDDVSRTHRVQLRQRTATYNVLAALVKRNRANQDATRDAGAIRSVVTGLKRYFKNDNLVGHPQHIELHLAALKALYALIEGNRLSQEQAQNDGVLDTLSLYIEKYCSLGDIFEARKWYTSPFRGLCRITHELFRTGTWDRDQFRENGTFDHLLNSLGKCKNTSQGKREVWYCVSELVKDNLANCKLIIRAGKMWGLCSKHCAHTLLPRLICLHAFVREGEAFFAACKVHGKVESIAGLITHALQSDQGVVSAVTACKILEESGTFVLDAWKIDDKISLINLLMSHVVSSLYEETRIHACRAVRTVVRNHAWLQVHCHDDRFITTIVHEARCFDGGSTTLVHELIMTMRELVRGCETMQLAFQHKGALSCLADLLRMRPVIETFLRESVYEAAAELILGNEEMISLAAEEGFLGLLRTFSESSPAAERLLEVLSSGATIDFHDAIDMQGIIETIRHSRGDVCALVDKLKLLSRLLVGNYAFQEHAGECGAVSTCAEVMQWYVDDYSVQIAGLRCLLALTNGNIRNQRESADLSLFSTIFVAMRAHGSRTELQTLGNAVLDMIVIRVLNASDENDGGHRHVAAINETSQNERSKVEMLLHRVAGSREHDREALLQFMDQADELCSEMLEGEYLALVNDLKQRYERLLER